MGEEFLGFDLFDDNFCDQQPAPVVQGPFEKTPIPNSPVSEIVIDVFKFLKRDAIEKCQIVSHQWNCLAIRCAQVLPLRYCRVISVMDISHEERVQRYKLHREKCIQKKKGEITEEINYEEIVYGNIDMENITVEFTCEYNHPSRFNISFKDLEKMVLANDLNLDRYYHIIYLKHCIFDHVSFDNSPWGNDGRQQEYLLSKFMKLLNDFNGEHLRVNTMSHQNSHEILLSMNYIDLKLCTINLVYPPDKCEKFLSEPERWKIPKNVEKIHVDMCTDNLFIEWLSDVKLLRFIQGQEIWDPSRFEVEFQVSLQGDALELMRKFIEKLIEVVSEFEDQNTVIKNYVVEIRTEYEDNGWPRSNVMFKHIPDFFYLPNFAKVKCTKELIENEYHSINSYTEGLIEKETVVIPIQDKWKVTIVMKKTWVNMAPKPAHRIYLFFYINFEKL